MAPSSSAQRAAIAEFINFTKNDKSTATKASTFEFPLPKIPHNFRD
jgi:hypothetical protein